MFDVKIDKFIRMMTMRAAKYSRSLENYELSSSVSNNDYGQDISKIKIEPKASEDLIDFPGRKYFNRLKLYISSPTLKSVIRELQTLKMFEDTDGSGEINRKAVQSVSTICSILFKNTNYVVNTIKLKDLDRILDMCIYKMSSETELFVTKMYTQYDLDFLPDNPELRKNERIYFLDACMKYDIELSGTLTSEFLYLFNSNCIKISNFIFERNEEDMRKIRTSQYDSWKKLLNNSG